MLKIIFNYPVVYCLILVLVETKVFNNILIKNGFLEASKLYEK